jgi:hypothetical protein
MIDLNYKKLILAPTKAAGYAIKNPFGNPYINPLNNKADP